MKSFVSVLLGSWLLANPSFAEVRVSESWNSQIQDAKFYRLEGVNSRTSFTDVVEVIGKRLRQNAYRQGLQVDGYSVGDSNLEDAIRDLRTDDGEFSALSPREIGLLRSFAEKNMARVYAANIETNYRGGTGLERVYLFVSKSKDVVLTVRKYYYAE